MPGPSRPPERTGPPLVPSLAPSATSDVDAALDRVDDIDAALDLAEVVAEPDARSVIAMPTAQPAVAEPAARPVLTVRVGGSIRLPRPALRPLSDRARRERLEVLRAARHRRALGYAAVMIGMWLSLWVGTSVQVREMLHLPFLFVHLASVIAGLGATVVLDAKAVQWVLGRATLSDVHRIEQAVTPLAWLGVTGLLFSGAFLSPDLGDPLTALKMVAVFVAAMNGVAIGKLTDALDRMPAGTPFRRTPTRLKLWCTGSATVSQLAWWCAVVLGMMNTAGG